MPTMATPSEADPEKHQACVAIFHEGDTTYQPPVALDQELPSDPHPPLYESNHTAPTFEETTDSDREKHEAFIDAVPVSSESAPAPTPILRLVPAPNRRHRQWPPVLTRISVNTHPIKSLLYLYAFSLVFCLLFCSFVYVVLIKGRVGTPGGVYWDAVKTNWVVGVLSQLSAIVTAATIKAVLGVLRTALVYRPNGSSFATWVGLGASDWWTVLQVAVVEGFMNIWCDIRLSLPILSLGFGSVVKFNSDFINNFVASPTTMEVYAGLIEPDLRVLNNWIPAADMAMFFLTWASGLLTNPMFSVEFALPNCTDFQGCRSIIMPGGLTTAWQAKPWLNESVYFGQFSNINSIRIENATGFVLRYEDPHEDSVNFDILTECIYTGSQINNGLQFCARQVGDSILAGWSACPKALLDQSSCNTDLSWRSLPINSSTLMTLYTLPTQTSYSLETQAVIDIVPLLPEPVPAPLSAEEYLTIMSRVLIPSVNSTNTDNLNINSLIYSITWMHRTFQKSFPSDKSSPTSYLHNILAIPLQFAITTTSFANYTAAERGFKNLELFTLPENMRTTATGGWANSRLKILPWAGWLFIATDLGVHLAMFVGIVWVLLRNNTGDTEQEAGWMHLGQGGPVKELADVRDVKRVTVDGWYVGHSSHGEEELQKQRWYKRAWKWMLWLRKGRRPRQEEEGDPHSRVPLLEFADEEAVKQDLAAWKVAWRYRMVRMIGSRVS